MAKNDKLIILKLMKIFEEQTDEVNKLTLDDLINRLSEFMDENYSEVFPEGFEITKKTLKKYIDDLNEIGFEVLIEGEKFEVKKYHHEMKLFDAKELMMIINALNSFKFLSEDNTESVKNKIKNISSKRSFEKFEKVIKSDPKLKVKDERVGYNLINIADALLEEHELTFKYNRYKIEGNKVVLVHKHDGRDYRIIPYGVALNSGKLYLVAKDLDAGIVKNFRVDFMTDIRFGDKMELENDFDVSDYLEHSLSMFGGTELINLKLRVNENCISNIKDYFGQKLHITKYEKKHIVIEKKVYSNDGLISVLLKFGDRIEVLEPESVREALKMKAQSIIRLYKASSNK